MKKKFLDKKVPTVHPDDKLEDVLKLLLRIPQSSVAVVNKRNKFVGELSQRTFLNAASSKERFTGKEQFGDLKYLFGKSMKRVRDLMTKHTISLSIDEDVHEVIRIFYNSNVDIIPILDEKKKLVGVVTDISLLRHFKELA